MTELNIVSRTQHIIVDPAKTTISVINAGPMGPEGPPGPKAYVAQDEPPSDIEYLWIDTDDDIEIVGGAITDISWDQATSTVVSDGIGDDATLTVATSTYAGLMSATDKVILDSLSSSGGSTNLSYNASTRVVSSDTGTDATLTLATTANPGLMTSEQFDKVEALAMVVSSTEPVAADYGEVSIPLGAVWIESP